MSFTSPSKVAQRSLLYGMVPRGGSMILLDTDKGFVDQMQYESCFASKKFCLVNSDPKICNAMKSLYAALPNVTVRCADFFDYLRSCKQRFDVLWYDSTSSIITTAKPDLLETLLNKTKVALSITCGPPRGPGAASLWKDEGLRSNEEGLMHMMRLLNERNMAVPHMWTYPGKDNARMNWFVLKVASDSAKGKSASRAKVKGAGRAIHKKTPCLDRRATLRPKVVCRASPRLLTLGLKAEALKKRGTRIRVFFDAGTSRGAWFTGTIASYDVALQECVVRYDDKTQGRLDPHDPTLSAYAQLA